MSPLLPFISLLCLCMGRPSFLFIMSDDLGYGEVSWTPGRTNKNLTTPNIDGNPSLPALCVHNCLSYTIFFISRASNPARRCRRADWALFNDSGKLVVTIALLRIFLLQSILYISVYVHMRIYACLRACGRCV